MWARVNPGLLQFNSSPLLPVANKLSLRNFVPGINFPWRLRDSSAGGLSLWKQEIHVSKQAPGV